MPSDSAAISSKPLRPLSTKIIPYLGPRWRSAGAGGFFSKRNRSLKSVPKTEQNPCPTTAVVLHYLPMLPPTAGSPGRVADPGLKLKQIREELGLRYREVEDASGLIAQKHHNSEYIISLSRLSDIENKGVLPTVYRLYSLCVIYRQDLLGVLGWYGIDLDRVTQDASLVHPSRTHLIGFQARDQGTVSLPLKLDPGLNFQRTTYLSRMIQQWGKIPLTLLDSLRLKDYRYGLIGADDYMMYPLLAPGSLVQIDESKREIQTAGWGNEFERPIYFLESRKGYYCCWCNLNGNQLILQPHSTSPCSPEAMTYPDDIDLLGQVVGIAMRLGRRGKTRPSTAPR